MHIYDTQIYILSTGPMLGTKFISLLFRVNIYNNSGVTQQPTVLVLEEIYIYIYISRGWQAAILTLLQLLVGPRQF